MSWLDPLNAHWSLPPEASPRPARRTPHPRHLRGRAWVGVVPFRVENVGPRGLNWLPGVSAFPELNVRTYVVHEGKPGVWFFSLDAANMLAVQAARAGRLTRPIFTRTCAGRSREGWIHYESERDHSGVQSGGFVGRYRPVGEVYHSAPGTLEAWLTERYCL
ncbi:MAG: DUF2071 domain-containing protein [Deltaproteobacteria bacterium]|nr:DUF2071 domain-containing protein [Deltaproteobacteria bacterium]